MKNLCIPGRLFPGCVEKNAQNCKLGMRPATCRSITAVSNFKFPDRRRFKTQTSTTYRATRPLLLLQLHSRCRAEAALLPTSSITSSTARLCTDPLVNRREDSRSGDTLVKTLSTETLTHFLALLTRECKNNAFELSSTFTDSQGLSPITSDAERPSSAVSSTSRRSMSPSLVPYRCALFSTVCLKEGKGLRLVSVPFRQ